MRMIAPDRTVGLGLAVIGEIPRDLPFLSVALPRNPLLRRLYLIQGNLRYGFAGAPVGAQRRLVRSFFRQHKVSLVLAEFGPTGAALREICRALAIPLVVNFHGYDATVMPKLARIRAAYALLARDAAGFICGSKHFRETVVAAGIPKERITVIPCGVRTDSFAVRPGRAGCRLVAVGRLTPKKAPLATLQAFSEARRTCPNLRLDVIGDGPLKFDCADFVAQQGLSECVTLHGACDHDTVRAILGAADIFVQHSIIAPNGDTESQGISLVEAMASALPVVATDHNGFSETVLQGKTGFLVPEHDVAGMASRIVYLAQNPDIRQRLGLAGRERACTVFDEAVISARLRDYLSSFAEI
jgi:glycosyltransferase involved in cell wall biosynthesis